MGNFKRKQVFEKIAEYSESVKLGRSSRRVRVLVERNCLVFDQDGEEVESPQRIEIIACRGKGHIALAIPEAQAIANLITKALPKAESAEEDLLKEMSNEQQNSETND